MERRAIMGIVWIVLALVLSLFLTMGLTGNSIPFATAEGTRLLSWIFY